MTQLRVSLLALLLTSAFSGSAVADDPSPHKAAAKAEERPLDPDRVEFGLLPAVAGNTDLGVIVGATAVIAKFDPAYYPYRWRTDLLAAIAFKGAPDGGVEIPIQSYAAILDAPRFFDDRLRLNVMAHVSWNATRPFFGIGSAAPYDPPWERYDQKEQAAEYERALRYYQYRDLQFAVRTKVFLKLASRMSWFVVAQAGGHISSLHPGSKLGEDIAGESGPYVKSLMVGVDDHALLEGTTGFNYDTRNHESNPTRGMFHEISLRVGQGLGSAFTYGGANLTKRFYFPLVEDRLVLASRFIADLLVGTPPIYELVMTGGSTPISALGGDQAVRGVPVGRYAGKLKFIGNLELRSTLASFTVLAQRMRFGAVAFVDGGVVRTDFASHPELDSGAPPIKYGIGGGLRLQWGEGFIIRGDFAKSPDGTGIYVGVGNVF